MTDPGTGGEPLPHAKAAAKLEAIVEAIGYSFPSGDVGQILDEIERGYRR
jgi:hypothetical protein